MAPRRSAFHSGKPHLVARLAKGWAYDPATRSIRKTGFNKFNVSDGLPKHTRVALQVPALAGKRERTNDEDDMARTIQIVPPKNTPMSVLLKRVQDWSCVEKAWLSPTVSPAAPSKP